MCQSIPAVPIPPRAIYTCCNPGSGALAHPGEFNSQVASVSQFRTTQTWHRLLTLLTRTKSLLCNGLSNKGLKSL